MYWPGVTGPPQSRQTDSRRAPHDAVGEHWQQHRRRGGHGAGSGGIVQPSLSSAPMTRRPIAAGADVVGVAGEAVWVVDPVVGDGERRVELVCDSGFGGVECGGARHWVAHFRAVSVAGFHGTVDHASHNLMIFSLFYYLLGSRRWEHFRADFGTTSGGDVVSQTGPLPPVCGPVNETTSGSPETTSGPWSP